MIFEVDEERLLADLRPAPRQPVVDGATAARRVPGGSASRQMERVRVAGLLYTREAKPFSGSSQLDSWGPASASIVTSETSICEETWV